MGGLLDLDVFVSVAEVGLHLGDHVVGRLDLVLQVVGDGVLELRMDVGQGYRAYLARSGPIAVLLFCGGDKSTQKADIKRAKTYWKDHEKRTRAAGNTG